MGAKLLNSTQKRKKALAYCYSLCAVLAGVALLFGTLYHSNLTQDFFFFIIILLCLQGSLIFVFLSRLMFSKCCFMQSLMQGSIDAVLLAA